MRLSEFLKGWGEQAFIATDQWINAVVTPVFTWDVAWADETLSARTYRTASEGDKVGKFFMPIIDVLFIWQKPDDEVNALAGKIVTRHCERAFYKEKLRRNLPTEYRL